MSITQVLGRAVAGLGITTLLTSSSVNPEAAQKVQNLNINSNNPITGVVPKEVNPNTIVKAQLQTPLTQAQVAEPPIRIEACIKDSTQRTIFDNLERRLRLGFDTVRQVMAELKENGIPARLNLTGVEKSKPFTCPKGTQKEEMTVTPIETQGI